MPSLRIIAAVGLLLLIAPCVLAAPGPDETAESKTYEVTLSSRSGPEYIGLVTFFGDENRPQRVETGDLELELMDNLNTEAELVLGTGRWISFRWFFGDFWIAVADTETGGRLFAWGFANSERIRGAAGIFGDEVLENGRYRLSGDVAGPPEDPLPE